MIKESKDNLFTKEEDSSVKLCNCPSPCGESSSYFLDSAMETVTSKVLMTRISLTPTEEKQLLNH